MIISFLFFSFFFSFFRFFLFFSVVDDLHNFAFAVLYARAVLLKTNRMTTKSSHYKSIYINRFYLSDPVSPRYSLIFYSWIPMRRSKVNLLKVLHVQSFASCLYLHNHYFWCKKAVNNTKDIARNH